MRSSSVMVVVVVVVVVAVGVASGYDDPCNGRSHVVASGGTAGSVVFARENSDREYGVESKFKSLHCCARGYRSIEWFKGDAPYPWSADVSTFIISPKSGNQTIYSQAAARTDSGRYTCVVRNDTHSLDHDVVLRVDGESAMRGAPRAMYHPRNQTREIGEGARFYCEAYVGEMPTPLEDVRGIGWSRVGGRTFSPFASEDGFASRVVVGEGGRVLSAHLAISQVKSEDYGRYTCRLGNGRDGFLDMNATLSRSLPKPKPWPWMRMFRILWFALIATAAILLLVGFRSRLGSVYKSWRNRVKRRRECDIFIVYHEVDKDVAANVIASRLENEYEYECGLMAVPSGESLSYEEVFRKSSRSERLIVVVGRCLVDNDWSCQRLGAVLHSLVTLHPRVITVFLEAPPSNPADEHRQTLRDLLRRVHYVEYSERKAENFWNWLSLGLPKLKTKYVDAPESVRIV